MKKTIKTCLIGFGFSGSTFHAPFLTALPQFLVTHVVSDNPELVRSIYPAAQVVSKQLILDCLANQEIDLIIISAPNKEHYKIAKQALMQNKHVLLEKPFVLDPTEGQELIDLANARKRILSVYHNRRWDSDFLTLKEVIKKRELGDINLFINRYDRYRPEVKSRWKESEEHGSGTLWDLGSHLIDQTLTLFGFPDTVYANLLSQRKGAKAIDFFDLQFGYKSGLCARLSSSSLCYSPGPKYEIHGSKGSFIKFGQDPQENSLIIRKEDPLDEHFGQEQPANYGHLITQEGLKQIPSLKGSYISFFKQLYNAISEKQEIPVCPKEALDVIKIIQLCEKSNDSQRLIECAEFKECMVDTL